MKQFKRILLAVESGKEDQPALKKAVQLARNNKASLKIIEVVPKTPPHFRRLFESLNPGRSVGEVIAQRLEGLVGPARKTLPEIKTLAREGDPVLEIVREVLRNDHDLLMKTAAQATSPSRSGTDTIDLRLLRKCPCPIWLVRPSHGRLFERILAPIDPDDKSKDRANHLNRKIMELALALADLEGGELLVLHAWEAFGEHLLSAKESQFYVEETRLRSRQVLDEFLSEFGKRVHSNQVHLRKGSPSSVILDFVRSREVDLVVMGTVCRLGVSGFLIGNTAEKILSQLDCSVLAVKPDDFQSPINLDDD